MWAWSSAPTTTLPSRSPRARSGRGHSPSSVGPARLAHGRTDGVVGGVARTSAVPEAASATVVAGGGLVLHSLRHVALLDGEALPLTPAEVDLLTALASRPGHSWSRGELVREVWQGEFIESDFLVDVYIGNLRRKLKRAGGNREWISTVDGTGYRFVP